MVTVRKVTSEAVAFALQELALSPRDQQGLSDFVTDYFASGDNEFSSGKQ